MEVKDLGRKFRIARIPPVDNVKPPKPSPLPQASSCEMTVQIGIFFDGTGNRLDPLNGRSALSNVARLHYTYPALQSLGSHRIYVPGLGTSFPSIGEDSDTRSGGAFACALHGGKVISASKDFKVLGAPIAATGDMSVCRNARDLSQYR